MSSAVRAVRVGDRLVGDGHPVYVVAEIGINHNGDLGLARRLIDVAATAGCDAVKFQKRDPETCVPPDQRDRMRDTPWGYISYLDYRYRVEFGEDAYRQIAHHARDRGIDWFVSCWDEPSVDFMEPFDPIAYKIPSASVTDHGLLKYTAATGRPLILSTGMSTMDDIRAAVEVLGRDRLVLTHSTSTYPCPPDQLNLRMIQTLRTRSACPPRSRRWPWGPATWSDTSPWTVRCGGATRPPRWSPRA